MASQPSKCLLLNQYSFHTHILGEPDLTAESFQDNIMNSPNHGLISLESHQIIQWPGSLLRSHHLPVTSTSPCSLTLILSAFWPFLCPSPAEHSTQTNESLLHPCLRNIHGRQASHQGLLALSCSLNLIQLVSWSVKPSEQRCRFLLNIYSSSFPLWRRACREPLNEKLLLARE